MSYKLWTQYPWYGCQMLWPLGELLSFERNKINKLKNYYFLLFLGKQKA
jgi:hypothetical protein